MPASVVGRRKRRARLDTDKEDEDEDQDPSKVLVQEDCVYFHSEVSKESVLRLIRALHEASRNAYARASALRDARVVLFIHSEGGDAYAGLSGMHHISRNKVPVHTVADGFVASAATFLLLGGQVRLISPEANLLIHQLQTGFWGKYCDLVDECKNNHALMRQIASIYVRHTKMNTQKVRSLLKQETTIGEVEAIRLGFVQAICTPEGARG